MKDREGYVKGNYSVCGVIGEPIEHTLSPLIHNEINRYIGKESVYVPYQVDGEKLDQVTGGAFVLGVKGLNVTMPYKQRIMKYLKEIEESAKRVGAINTIVRGNEGYKGYNTDVYGIKMAMLRNGIDYKGKDVAIIGSGGAAYAAAECMLKEVKTLHIFNRTKENAQRLKEYMSNFYDIPIKVYSLEEKSQTSIDIVIQTTGVGMGVYKDQMPLCTMHLLESAQGVMDMIYSPWETPFIKAAKAKGIVAINGFDMLFYQAVKAYELMHDEVLGKQNVEVIRENVYELIR